MRTRAEALQRLRALIEQQPEEKLIRGKYFGDVDCCCVVGLVAKDVGLTPDAFVVRNNSTVEILSPEIMSYLLEFGLDLRDLDMLQDVNDETSDSYRKTRLIEVIDEILAEEVPENV